jgi:molybdate transport system ATP-binding protein
MEMGSITTLFYRVCTEIAIANRLLYLYRRRPTNPFPRIEGGTTAALAAKSMIRLQDITLRVRDRFLFAGTSWEIREGENWAVIGPNGAGKSSLVGALAGEVPVVGGRITRTNELQMAGKIGYLSFERHREVIAAEEARDEFRFFSGRLTNGLTTRKLLAGACRTGEIDSPDIKHLAGKLGIHGLLQRRVRNLSTGEIRMVLVARELLKKPRLLILDEPFRGLDENADRRLAGLIDEMMQERIQVVLVTHHLEKIGPHITHLLAVKSGQVFFQGPRRQGLDPEPIRKLYAVSSEKVAAPPSRGTPTLVDLPSESEPVWIEMKDVCIRYGDQPVLENLNWRVCRHENWLITGPNGAGKTTLLRLVTADHPQAYANEIFLFGRRRGSGESIWEIKNRIGMISSEFQIRYRKPIPAFDVVLSGLFDSVGLYRNATSEQRELALCWMQTLRIADKSDRLFHTLSQGEQRMVLLTRAMIKSPLLLILDEPCQGLDPQARKRLLELIDWIGHQPNTQLLYVTHHPAEMLSCITHELRFEKKDADGFRVIQQPFDRWKRKGVLPEELLGDAGKVK